jgi:transketolase
MEVAALLADRGVSCRVLSMHTVKPLDVAAVTAAATQTRLVVTIEEHSILGGLGGAAAEVMAEMAGAHAPLKRIGLPSAFAPRAGSRDYLAHEFGLSTDAIVTTVLETLSSLPRSTVVSR